MSGEELEMHLKELSDVVDQVVVNGLKEKEGEKSTPTGSESAAASENPQLDDIPSVESMIKATANVDVKTLSDAELIQYLTVKDYERQKARYERYQNKAKLVPKDHKFWNTQPVLPLTEEVTDVNCPIDDNEDIGRINTEPYNMPAGFEWCALDVMDAAEIQELYNLLNRNYVEDDEAMFRFDYSVNFLQWALTVPGYLKEWHVGVRNSKTKALMGCITAIPVHVRVYDKVVAMAEINFLCVHKKLRTKRLAPVLIKEITLRVNLTGRWQAVYTAGVVLPKPVARCRYFHRSLNPKKLIEVRFSSLPPQTTLASHVKNLKLPKRPTTHGLRRMVAEDAPKVLTLLQNYLSNKTKLCQSFTLEEVAHMLVPRSEVVSTYVVEDDRGNLTDMCSFYYLPSTVIGNPIHNKLNAVYSYYNVANTVSVEVLMQDLLILAREEGADVLNALDLMENEGVFRNLQFGAGDGYLQYYLYNWKCATMDASSMGLVLL